MELDSVDGFVISALRRGLQPVDVVECDGHRYLLCLLWGRQVRRIGFEGPAGVGAETDEAGEDACGSD